MSREDERPRPGLVMILIMGLGFVALLGVFALAVFGLVTAKVPLTDSSLIGMWIVAILFGLLSLRVVSVGMRMLRVGGIARIDDLGVSNLKEGIGPIPWSDIRGASVQSLGRVRRVGVRSVLFVEMTPSAANRHLRRAAWLSRMTLGKHAAKGELPIMGSPPYTRADLDEVAEQIRGRVRKPVAR